MGEILTREQWDDIRLQLIWKHPDLTNDDMPYYEAEEQDMLSMIDYKLRAYKQDRLQTKS